MSFPLQLCNILSQFYHSSSVEAYLLWKCCLGLWWKLYGFSSNVTDLWAIKCQNVVLDIALLVRYWSPVASGGPVTHWSCIELLVLWLSCNHNNQIFRITVFIWYIYNQGTPKDSWLRRFDTFKVCNSMRRVTKHKSLGLKIVKLRGVYHIG